MAIKSMTGYGTASARTEKMRVTVALSSVNRKQFDLALRLPPQLAGSESHAQKIIQEKISRGRISGTVQIETTDGSAGITVNRKIAEETIRALRREAKALHLPDDLSASALLRIPGVLAAEKPADPSDALRACFEKALSAALKKLNSMRAREGRTLDADFAARLNLLESMLEKIKARAPETVAAGRARLLKGLKQSGLKTDPDDERILKEIALFAERSDISEEIARLASHISQFKKILRGSGPGGRTLDFLAQEFFREINTIASKANDLKITQQVLRFKTELERIREQIQNVE